MHLTDKDVNEFATIWESEFGERLDADRAAREAKNFLELCFFITQALPNEPDYVGPPIVTL